jgi:hypothetical protein
LIGEYRGSHRDEGDWRLFDKRYWPGDTLADHMTFAMRHEDRVNQSLANTAASLNYHSARPPRLIQIDAPASSRLSRDKVGTAERLFVHGHCKSFRPDLGLSWHHQADRLSHRSRNNTRRWARLELRSLIEDSAALE